MKIVVRQFAFALMVNLMVAPSIAADRLEGEIQTADSHVQATTLSNGLKLIVEYRPGRETATCTIWINVGSRHEFASLNGISHLLEHLLVGREGAERGLKSKLIGTGARINATTSFEWTNYYFTCLTSEFETAFDSLAAMVVEPDFSPEHVARERDIVVREASLAKNDPMAIAYYTFIDRFLPGNSLGRPIIGKRRSLRRIQPQHLHTFHAAHYAPNNTVITVTGGIPFEKVLDPAQKHFGSLDSRDLPDAPIEPVDEGRWPVNLRIKTLVNAGYLGVGVVTDGFEDHYRYEMTILESLLGSGKSSRLIQRIKEEEGLADSVFSIADMAPGKQSKLSDIGLWGVGAQTSPKNLDRIKEILQEELEKIRTVPLDTRLLERTKREIRNRMILRLESDSYRSHYWASAAIHGPFESPSTYLDRLDALTPEQIREAAASRFADDRLILISVEPARGFGKIIAALKYLLFRRI